MSSSLLALRRVPERFDGASEINANFQALKSALERAIQTGDLIAEGALELAGDVTGTDDDTLVERVRGVTFGAPTSGDDGKAVVYSHSGPSFGYADKLNDVFTTRGDLLRRGASTEERVAIGAANTVLLSDGTDPGWATVTSALDALFSNAQGAVLYRGAAAWAALAPGTSGKYLKTQGAAADPMWDTVASDHGALSGLSDDDHPHYLLATGLREWDEQGSTPSTPAATKWKLYFKSGGLYYIDDAGAEIGPLAPSGGTTHALLSATHTDTTAGTVARGDVITGQGGTPAWARLALGAAGKYLYSDGTDVLWSDPPAAASHNLLSATHSDTTAGSVVAGDIIYGDATPKWTRLPKAANGDVLTLASGLPTWAAPTASAHNLLSGTHSDTTAASVTRGDLIVGVGSSTKWERFAKGARSSILMAGADEPKYAPYTGWNTVPGLVPLSHVLWRMGSAYVVLTAGTATGTGADAAEWPIQAQAFTNGATTTVGYSVNAGGQARYGTYFKCYAKIADNTDGAAWIGFGSASPTAAATGTGHMAIFRCLNGTDTNWQACTRDGANLGNTDTGVALDTNYHCFEVYTTDVGVTWVFKIDGVVVATRTTNVPNTSTNFLTYCWIVAVSSSTRDIRIGAMFNGVGYGSTTNPVYLEY